MILIFLAGVTSPAPHASMAADPDVCYQCTAVSRIAISLAPVPVDSAADPELRAIETRHARLPASQQLVAGYLLARERMYLRISASLLQMKHTRFAAL